MEIIEEVMRTCEVNRFIDREGRRERIQVTDPTYVGWEGKEEKDIYFILLNFKYTNS